MIQARPLRASRCVVWLAAYPKSGSTWMRTLLANLRAEPQPGCEEPSAGEREGPRLACEPPPRKKEPAPIPINALRTALPGSTTASREHFDEFTGLASADCTDAEAARLRPAVYRARAERHASTATPFFYVAHDAYQTTPSGEPLFPDDISLAAVYLARNPLDVAVSWAFYAGHEDLAAGVAMLGSARAGLLGPDWPRLGQRLLDWSGHVRSWRAAPFPVLTVRYEDLLADTAGELARVARFLRLDGADDPTRLRRAAAFSDFALLRAAEQREGFNETPTAAQRFFRSGKAGDGRRLLSAGQVREVLRVHGRTMATLGYR